MDVPEHPTQIRRMLEARLKQVSLDKPLLLASLSLVNKRCGKPSCHCNKGGPLHQAYHLTHKEGRKRRTVYVPQDLLAEVQSWVAEHTRLKILLQEINQLTLALVKSHHRHQRRKAGRV
jgi:hypothetical protein